MYARTSSWTGSAEAIGRWVEAARERVAPMVAAQPGNVGAIFLVDRDGRRALTLTVWDSEAAARASDETAEQSRAATVAATGVTLAERGRHEVVARVGDSDPAHSSNVS